MARGMAAGEPIISQANTEAFDEGYRRVFGDRAPQRGRWVATPTGLVPADEYRPADQAINAPILAGRFYENTCATDGTDIGSRRKHREYMKAHGLTVADDYRGEWARKAKDREAVRQECRLPSKARREALERAMYRITKP